jgi:hypothetical protein
MPASAGAALRGVLAAIILYLVLVQPNHPAAMTWGALAVVPLELPVVLAFLVLAGRGLAGRALRVVLIAALVVVALLKVADFATFVAYNRGFNIVVDLGLVPAAWNMAAGAVGTGLAALGVGGAVLALALVIWALWWATGVWAGYAARRWARPVAVVVALPALAIAVAEIGHARRAWALPPDIRAQIPGAAFTARVALERAAQVRETRADIRAFRAAAEVDALAQTGPHFDLLGERDLILLYVESYGRSSFDNPLYAATHMGTLSQVEAALAARGLAMRSAWATAPMAGGQSWLAHGSVAAGLWLNTQGRYRALLASPRQTLFHFAQRAGRRTVAIKPAHVFPWPEGAYFGFDAIYNAVDLGYAGLPFNWVTMPDQFTLAALDRLERHTPQGTPGRAPLVVQVALVSSHAPWVPIAPLLPWADLGDGSVFNSYATAGDPPEVVWRDHDRVREQFRLAIDYSLQVAGAWAERHADDPPLIVVLGDHQPAGFVAGVPGYDVPVHVIGPPDLVARFAALGWSEGMHPDPALAPIRMDRLRDLLVGALSTTVR